MKGENASSTKSDRGRKGDVLLLVVLLERDSLLHGWWRGGIRDGHGRRKGRGGRKGRAGRKGGVERPSRRGASARRTPKSNDRVGIGRARGRETVTAQQLVRLHSRTVLWRRDHAGLVRCSISCYLRGVDRARRISVISGRSFSCRPGGSFGGRTSTTRGQCVSPSGPGITRSSPPSRAAAGGECGRARPGPTRR